MNPYLLGGAAAGAALLLLPTNAESSAPLSSTPPEQSGDSYFFDLANIFGGTDTATPGYTGPVDYGFTGDPAGLDVPGTSVDYGAGNLSAFLATIRLGESGDVYNRLYGGGYFTSYADHPTFTVGFSGSNNSRAAGAYQFQPGTWKEAQAALSLPDFSPDSQDAAAIFLIKRRGAYDDVLAGRVSIAREKLKQEWAFFQDWQVARVVNQYELFGGDFQA